MKAVILNIGDEVLSGKTINTNSSFLATSLDKLGISVERVVVVGDNKEDIAKEILEFKNSKYDILISTGGLGPTHDDLSKEVIFDTLGYDLIENEESLNKLSKFFKGSIPRSNYKQVLFPKEAIIVNNELGTANGAILKDKDKHYFILVGPPTELNPMFLNTCYPYLKTLRNEYNLITEYNIMGQGESYFEDLLQVLLNELTNVTIAPYANVGMIRYVIKASKKYEAEYKKVISSFEKLMDNYIISKSECLNNLAEVEEVVFNYLEKLNFTISFSESITGGMISSLFINNPGASKYLKESFITYSDEAKIKYLSVRKESIDKYSAVSSEVALEMAEGLASITKADVSFAITGYAGPGGEKDKLGLVYYAVKIKENLHVFDASFNGNRNMIRRRAMLFGLYKLVVLLKEELKKI